MFNRNNKQPETKKRRDLSQYGLFNIGMEDPENMDDDAGGDSDLEAELAAITAGGGRPKPVKKAAVAVPQHELDKMIADSLRDIPSDEELSGDDDDPDLLNELTELTGEDASNAEATGSESPIVNEPPSDNTAKPVQDIFLPTTSIDTAELIKSRIPMYKLAEKNAKETGDTSKARRFGRGLKTLETLLKQAQAGQPVNNDDIPPEVFLKPAQNESGEAQPSNVSSPSSPAKTPETPTTPSQNSPPAPSVASTAPESIPVSLNVDETKINILLARQREYKVAALTKKREGDHAAALQYVKMIKMFDAVLAAARQGQEVDLSDMPPPPNELPLNVMTNPDPPQTSDKGEAETQQGAGPVEPPKKAPEEPPPAPTSILEALVQRLEKYKSVEKEAKDEGNTSKARRFGRITKQYEDAIKFHKAGKPVPFDELPTPPGFGPIPVPGTTPAAAPSAPAIPPIAKATPPKPAPEKTSPPARPPLHKQESRVSGNHSNTSVMSKTIDILLIRQQEFKAAALAAKKAGEVEQAKEYLKTFKGIENLLNVAKSGLPVDLTTLPISPNQRATLEDTFSVIEDVPAPEGDAQGGEELHDIYARLEEQLQKQLTICRTTRDHHKVLGDVAGMNRFENLALSVQKDLDIVRFARRKKTTVPKFHYEQKSFNVVKCNTDIAETELEINVVRGISYNVTNPKEIDTYVKFEFAYPTDTPYKTKTQVIYNTENPEYNERFIAPINPKARLCQRVFKRGGIKFEVYAKGGFFRSDTLLGVATVKLQPLETACEIHDSFDLMDGRKAVGGKLEVKIRLRNPILTKQVEQLTEKWVIIGS